MPKRLAADDAPAVELSPPHLEGVDELSAEVFRALHATLRLHKQLMTRTLAAHGTHPGQATCLRLLAVHDGITQRDLAEALHLARPTVSKMLQAMEKAGVVERRPDETDQRLTCVKLTAAGRALERDLRAVAADYVNETIGTLPEGDRRELARLLDDLAASISRATDEL
jgi:DNA-binding MarR family transcriptional regulator